MTIRKQMELKAVQCPKWAQTFIDLNELAKKQKHARSK